jgi:divalent anion:Na+ symporter, DASS family
MGSSTLGGEHAQLLGEVELFRGLDRVTLAKLAAHLEVIPMRRGEILFRQGDAPDGLYLVSRGEVSISAGPTDDAIDVVELSTLTRGEAFGEIALLTGSSRSATARAATDGELLRLQQRRFHDLVQRDPLVSLAISAGLIRRLRGADAARLGVPSDSLLAARNGYFGGPIPEMLTAPGPLRPRLAPVQALRRWPRKRVIGIALAIVILSVGWLVMPPSGLAAPGWHALLSLVALVPLLALDALPESATALLLVAIWVVGGVAPPRTALSGFASTTWVLTLCTFAAGAAIAASGLLYRIALSAVARAGGFKAQVTMLGLGGLILGPAVPNSTGRTGLIAAALAELADALGYEEGSPAAVGLAMAAFTGFGLIVSAFQTSSSTTLLALALLPDDAKANLNFITWALRTAPLQIVLLVGLLGFILWRYAPRAGQPTSSPSLSAVVRVQQTLLGKVSVQERLAGGVAVGLLVGFASQPLHGIDPAWIAVIAFAVLAAGGGLTQETLRAVNWNTLLLLGVLGSMAEVVSTAKLDTWLSPIMASDLGGLGTAPIVFVGALAVLCLLLSLVLRWQAAVPLVLLALTPVARGAGIDPFVVAVVTLTASNTFFMPFQSTSYMALYTGGGARLFHHRQARIFAFVYAAVAVLGLLVSVPFWHLLGLL